MPVLLCDLDDTLFDHNRATRDSLANLRGCYQALECWSLDELDARHRVLLETLHLEVLAGRLLVDDARRERFSRLLAQAGLVNDAEAAAAMASTYRMTYAAQWHPVAGALEFLQAIRADGHSVVLVTNNGVAEQQLKLERCGFTPWIDLMLTSEEAGVSKPRREIFDQALERIGTTASDAVMLGDAWATDIEGARAAGVTPVWFNPTRLESPDPRVAELASLAPAADALAVLRRAGLGKGSAS